MNRRAALRLGGLALSGGLGGCSTLLPEDTTVTVSEIVLRNRLADATEVDVLLLDDGDVVYWRTVTVPTAPDPFAILRGLPESSGAYELYAHVPAVERDPPVQADLTEAVDDRSCLTVTMEITTARVDGDEVPSVVYGTIGECRSPGD